jgi:prophage tail gpP-like protein
MAVMTSDSAICLAVRGMLWRGWETVSLHRSIEQVAHTFDLRVTERWPGQPDRREIKPSMACAIGVDGDVWLAGYIDEVNTSYHANERTVSVRGRGLGGDLADGAVLPPWEYGGLDLLGACARICAPFGISVQAEVDLGQPFSRFAVQPGETAFAAIERACRMRAILPIMTGTDTLILTRAGRSGMAAAPLILGGDAGNIKSCSARTSFAERFSEYRALGQQEHNDATDIEDAVGPVAAVVDPEITRYRPTVLLGEAQGDGVTLQQRAEWQAKVAKGRSNRATYVVQGWRAGPSRQLWLPNTLVTINDPWSGFVGSYLIVSVTLSRQLGDGTLASLEIADPDAFDPDPQESSS